MGFFGFLILGLIAGAIAKAIMPGRQGGGWFSTLILGVVGAFVGGWLGGLIFHEDLIRSFWSVTTWITAIVGSLIVLLIWGVITKRRV
ncbi:GlsB/YeaQ/YmgE family stress response membrane protein [Sinomonas sp. ASV322]|uniref:GlsB/YeaQ/YmgE family stress response membrane protein n=1 Tax=Sinomonas sp. ASV322 TaxID=3041920 RepID=UPI0027DB4D32|nr:GlsB/YeaQ/YmgE family stress response membrane protein [Sinomonas sp. ASV322]MDQ4501917.1 GlsB/YeaQ/YmgE family stress response membrane protein [Sinomonas sp. ASV322]